MTCGAGDLVLLLARVAGVSRRVAHMREAAQEPLVRAAGATDLIIDSVGGPVLGQSLRLLRPGGTCVTLGNGAGNSVTFDS